MPIATLSDSTSSSQQQAEHELENRRPSEGTDGNNKNNESEFVEPAAQNADEYPSGTTLIFIVVALVLSVFLSSLDIVGEPHPRLQV